MTLRVAFALFLVLGAYAQPHVIIITPHGPDPARYLEMIKQYEDAGFTHVYIHQIGENQDEFADFAQRELMPKL